jgi:hypothetical protein
MVVVVDVFVLIVVILSYGSANSFSHNSIHGMATDRDEVGGPKQDAWLHNLP